MKKLTMVRRLAKHSVSLEKQWLAGFDVSLKQMRRIRQAVRKEMAAGLSGKKSSLAMYQAYCDAASGHEKGLYLALDLGGTNFRVMMIKLPGMARKPVVIAEAKYKLTRRQISATGDILFGAIAGYLRKFLKDNRFSSDYGLGYTFSFPFKLLGIDEGILMRWTKEFSAKGVVGRKIVQLQREAMVKQGVTGVKIVALANDTVGTLQAQAAVDPNCVMGVILGTGFNISVRVASRRIGKGVGAYRGKSMIINTECGNFDKALPLTVYDRRVDRESVNIGQQLAEKAISGKYLPLLVRQVVLDLVRRGGLFSGRVPDLFKDGHSFHGRHMDMFDAGSGKDLQKLSQEFFGGRLTAEERLVLSQVCRSVARRSARIAASIIAGSLAMADRRSANKVTVAVDGSLFEKYPGYRAMLKKAFMELEGKAGYGVSMKLTKDGSGVGAAVIAAVVGDSPVFS